VLIAIALADPYHGTGTRYVHNPSMEQSASNPTGAVVAPISTATTFIQSTPGAASAKDDPNSFGKGFEYSRTGNPTRGAFERAVAAAEKCRHCVAFSSGSAATSAVIHLLSPGERIMCIDDVYGGTQRYLRRIVRPRMGIGIDFVNFHDAESVKAALKPGKTKLMWLETPTNPTLRVTDIQMVANLAHENGCWLAVDNTFCSPYFQTPFDHGADIVVHSVTKYINGHSDVVMGVSCCNHDDLYDHLRFTQNGVGAVPSPFDCYLALRGFKTLHLRMEASSKNANAIALFLQSHPAVAKVLYPGLTSHPQHQLATKQQHGFGAMITFYCKGSRQQAALILENLHVFALAESLGAVESLAESPSLMTHASVPSDQRVLLGIDDTLIRLSVGIESCNDLIADLDGALEVAFDSL